MMALRSVGRSHQASLQQSNARVGGVFLVSGMLLVVLTNQMLLPFPLLGLPHAFAGVFSVGRSSTTNLQGSVRRTSIVRSAEADFIDAEIESESDPGIVKPKKSSFFKKFKGKHYQVTRQEDGTFRFFCEDERNATRRSGRWNNDFNQPMYLFNENYHYYLQRFRKLKRLYRRRHGRGERYPNGQLIFLTKLGKSPFMKIYGDKYNKEPAWRFKPTEVEEREREMRVRQLRRKIRIELEEKRLARLHEMGVWTGDKLWRKPWLRFTAEEAFQKWGPFEEWSKREMEEIRNAREMEPLEEEEEDEDLFDDDDE